MGEGRALGSDHLADVTHTIPFTQITLFSPGAKKKTDDAFCTTFEILPSCRRTISDAARVSTRAPLLADLQQ